VIAIITLQLLSITLIFLEILIPSMGLLSIFAIGAMSASWYLINQHHAEWITFFLVGDILLVPLTIFLGFRFIQKSPLTLKTTLSNQDGYQVHYENEGGDWLGKAGITTSPLRPFGKIRIGDLTMDACMEEGFANIGEEVQVVAVEPNKIIVKVLKPQSKENQ
jgi:membrane-bound serine protease (ClpP class)